MNQAQPNPFAPPKIDNDLGGVNVSQVASHYVLATRGERFLAAMIDGVIMLVPFVFVVIGSSITAEGWDPESHVPAIAGWLLILSFLGQFILQWYLIAQRGQTLGKIALKIRIEHLDGRPVSFFTGVILRNWILGVANVVLGVVGLIDVLFIFGHEQRCLHDLIAGTRVVVAHPVSLDPEGPRWMNEAHR